MTCNLPPPHSTRPPTLPPPPQPPSKCSPQVVAVASEGEAPVPVCSGATSGVTEVLWPRATTFDLGCFWVRTRLSRPDQKTCERHFSDARLLLAPTIWSGAPASAAPSRSAPRSTHFASFSPSLALAAAASRRPRGPSRRQYHSSDLSPNPPPTPHPLALMCESKTCCAY